MKLKLPIMLPFPPDLEVANKRHNDQWLSYTTGKKYKNRYL